MPSRFLAIMFTDVVGATRLFGRQGDDRTQALLRERRELLAALASEHGGEIRNAMGDGLCVTFPSAPDAVRCAVAIQAATYDAGHRLRIGIDAGEPLLDAHTGPEGVSVITASRLRDLADGGQILVSEVVRVIAGPHVAEAIQPAGSMRLRDLPEPVAVAHVAWREEDASILPGPQPQPDRPIRVVIADDQRLLRAGFRVILDAEPDITVVGEAENGRTAVDTVLRRRPDVVLMDIRMPELDGLDAAERILAEPGLNTTVVVLTTFDATEYVYRALRMGVSGFLLKDTPSDRLLDAVRVAAAGDALIAPSITKRLVEQFSVSAPDAASAPQLAELTPRELEVLRLLARGLSNSEIAQELVVGENTVKTHVARVLGKLGLRDRVQAVVLAYESGLIRTGEPRS